MTDRLRTLGAILYPDFELLDLWGPLEMFGSLGPDALRIATVAEASGPVASAQGPERLARFDFANAPPLDLLLLPGGIGTPPQLASAAMHAFPRERAKRAEVTMSVCSGSAIFAKAGLLDGRRATSNKQFFSLAAGQSEKTEWVEKARWVEHGPFVTSSGFSAGIDMSLAGIAKPWGCERAEAIANFTEYEWHTDSPRDPFHRLLNQAAATLASVGTK